MQASRRLVLAFAAALMSGSALAQAWPTKPIRIVVPFPPGGGTDIIARETSERVSKATGWTFVIDNKPGAGGNLGVDSVAKSPADGYTLVLGQTSNLAINPSLYAKLPYDPQKDLVPVVLIAQAPLVLVTGVGSKYKTLADVTAAAKAKPGQLNFAATGTNNLLAAEQFNHMAGIKLTAVNYKGTGQAVTAVMSGEVQSFIMSPLIAVPQVKAGKLRAIGITGLKRSPALPDVPPIADTLKGFENITWHSVVITAKTPKPIVAKLSKELMHIIKSPDISQRIEQQGLDAVGSTPEQLASIIKVETQMYGKLVKQIGLKPQDY
jgi:tripartite-type tricarboxylate transporter receptor subunit TctC